MCVHHALRTGRRHNIDGWRRMAWVSFFLSLFSSSLLLSCPDILSSKRKKMIAVVARVIYGALQTEFDRRSLPPPPTPSLVTTYNSKRMDAPPPPLPSAYHIFSCQNFRAPSRHARKGTSKRYKFSRVSPRKIAGNNPSTNHSQERAFGA